jgi:transcriptional antiterminator RfaH
MQLEQPAWYCARTKAKHEHIAAANLRKHLGLDVFQPRFRIERVTRRGVVRLIEPVFPCYVFVRFVLEKSLSEVQHTKGVRTLVHFGGKIPSVQDSVIDELVRCFESEEPVLVCDRLSPGDEVTVGEGAFAGMRANVLRVMPARQRVQILLDVLGGPTPVEVDRSAVVLENSRLASRVPALALAC